MVEIKGSDVGYCLLVMVNFSLIVKMMKMMIF